MTRVFKYEFEDNFNIKAYTYIRVLVFSRLSQSKERSWEFLGNVLNP